METLKKSPKSRIRISIGTKFLVLIVTILVVTMSSLILNATRMFRADNLDTISLSADLLAASKAGEVRSWAESLLSRGQSAVDTIEAGLQPRSDNEILWIQTGAPGKKEPRVWKNTALLKSLGLNSAEGFSRAIETAARPGSEPVRAWRHPSGRTLLVFRIPSGKSRTATLVSSDQALTRMFAQTGPYAFALLNGRGEILAQRDPEKSARLSGMLETRKVKRGLASETERELTEFDYDGAPYLGAFAKVKVGRMSVFNLVPRSTALETGDTLIRRSVLIGALLFLLAFIVAQLLTRSIISPVLQLSSTAKEISLGNYTGRVKVRTRDEISDLASSFNRMSDEISRRIETLARINQVAVKARSMTEPQQILDFAVEALSTLFGFGSAVGVYAEKLSSGGDNLFRTRRNWGERENVKGLAQQSAHLKTPSWIDSGGENFLSCPILHQGNSRGWIILGRGQSLSQEDMDLAQTVLSIFCLELESVTFSRELQAINAELEQRVDQRTRELKKANEGLKVAKKEVDDVMDNIQQGILTFGADGSVNREHSKYAQEIFVGRDIAGTPIVDLIAGSADESRREDLKEWLKTVFEEPAQWSMLQDFGVREVRYTPDEEGASSKDLRLEWRPILSSDESLSKMMLVCVDVTEQKRLESEIAKQEAEHSDQLEIIAQLVNHSRSVVEQFISDFSRNFESVRKVLEQSPENLREEALVDLMRPLHTIKGAAKQFRLSSIQQCASSLETLTSKAIEQSKGGPIKSETHADLTAEFKVLETLLEKMLSLYEKVAKGGAKAVSSSPTFRVSIDRVSKVFNQVFAGEGVIPAPSARKVLGWIIKAPVSALFDRLIDLAQSLAPELDREIGIEVAGGEVELDPRIQEVLYDGLMHVVRNSLDHGGETPADREARGRPAQMTLKFSAQSLPEGRVRIAIEDDGKGIAVAAVRARAIERCLVSAKAAADLTPENIIQFVFLPGFSTKDTVTEISGRGVGMEVIKNIVERELKGEVLLSSVEGEGTRLELIISGSSLLS